MAISNLGSAKTDLRTSGARSDQLASPPITLSMLEYMAAYCGDMVAAGGVPMD